MRNPPSVINRLQRAEQLRSVGRADDAVRELQEAIALAPDYALAHARLAILLAEQHRSRDALREAQEAIRLAPDDEFSHYALACVWLEAGKWKRALAAAQRAVELSPEDADNQAILANICVQLNRWDEADRASSEALALDPHHSSAIAARAATLRATGRSEQADAALREQLAHDAGDDIAHCSLGWNALRSGKRREAIAHFRDALRLDPTYADAREGLAAAIRSRSLIYGLLFRMTVALADKKQWMVWVGILGFILLPRLLRKLDPSSVPLQMAGAVAQFIVLIGSFLWVAMFPLGTVALRLDRDGHASMTPRERRGSAWLLAIFLATFAGVLISPWMGRLFSLLVLAAGASVAICVNHLINADTPAQRRVLVAVLFLVGIVCAFALAPFMVIPLTPLSVLPRWAILLIGAGAVYGYKLSLVALLIAWFSDDLARWIGGARRDKV